MARFSVIFSLRFCCFCAKRSRGSLKARGARASGARRHPGLVDAGGLRAYAGSPNKGSPAPALVTIPNPQPTSQPRPPSMAAPGLRPAPPHTTAQLLCTLLYVSPRACRPHPALGRSVTAFVITGECIDCTLAQPLSRGTRNTSRKRSAGTSPVRCLSKP